MGDGAVVALEVVLDADLPVGVVLGFGPLVEDERVDVDATLCDEPRQVAEVVGQRGGVESGLTKTNGPQVLTCTGRRPWASRSKPGSSSARGAVRNEPSRSYVQAWYGHCSVSRRPAPSHRR